MRARRSPMSGYQSEIALGEEGGDATFLGLRRDRLGQLFRSEEREADGLKISAQHLTILNRQNAF